MSSTIQNEIIFPTPLLWGEIYNINEKYIYLKEPTLGIKVRVDRRGHPNITEENFLISSKSLPLISFIVNKDEKTDSGVYAGYSKGAEQLAWEEVYKQGSIYDFNIFFVNEISFKIKFNNLIYEQEFKDSYDALKIYFLSGMAYSGLTVPLLYRNWKSKTNSPNFEYPYLNSDAKKGDYVQAEIFYVREQSVKRQSKLRDIFYFIDDKKFIYRVESSALYDYKKYVKINKKYKLVIDIYNKFEGVVNAHFDSLFVKSEPKKYFPNELVKVKVVNPMPRGVYCISEENEDIFLTKDQITKNNNIKVFNLLSPGDEIVLVVKTGSVGDQAKNEFDFIKLESRIFESEKLNDLFDVRASYKKGTISGFGRTSEFRTTVIEYFNHTCALCGTYMKFSNFSSAEAAHIVPRSSRGVNKLENSLCLCKEHHWSFDRGLWSVDSKGKVVISKQLEKDTNFNEKYGEYLGRVLSEKILEKINSDAFEWHRLNLFKE